MTEHYLSCNFKNCGKKLKEQAYVTSCSHIFCVEHGHKSIKYNNLPPECMVCGTKFDKPYDFTLINLNPNDQYKSMILTGLNPDTVLEIASRSISYYIYQLTFDNTNKDNIIKQIKRQNDEMKEYCKNIYAKYKNDLTKIQNKLKSLQKEVEEKNRDIESMKHQLTEANRLNKKLQVQLDTYKRRVTLLKTEKESSDNEFLIDSNRRVNLATPTFNFRNMINEQNNGDNQAFNIYALTSSSKKKTLNDLFSIV